MKNCHTCALAEDQGEDVKCNFNPDKLIAQFPFYPVVVVTVRRVAVHKEKVPDRDCPAFKPRKGAA